MTPERPRGVSPVLGVMMLSILLITMTVLFAGVFGVFGVQIGALELENSPQVSVELSTHDTDTTHSTGLYQEDADESARLLTIRHESGEKLPSDELCVVDDDGASVSPASHDMNTGDTTTVVVGTDDTVWVVLKNGTESTTITEADVQNV